MTIPATYRDTSPGALFLYLWDEIDIATIDPEMLHLMVLQERARVLNRQQPEF